MLSHRAVAAALLMPVLALDALAGFIVLVFQEGYVLGWKMNGLRAVAYVAAPILALLLVELRAFVRIICREGGASLLLYVAAGHLVLGLVFGCDFFSGRCVPSPGELTSAILLLVASLLCRRDGAAGGI